MDIRPIAQSAQPGPGVIEKQATSLVNEAPARPVAQPAEPAANVQQPASVPNMGQVSQAVKSINKLLQETSPPQNVEFTIDSDSDRTIVKVVDQKTKEVLRQMPTEEALEIAKALDLSQGLLIRQKA